MNKATRLQIGIYLLLVLVMVLLALREWNNYTVGAFLDDGMYVILAESFSRASGYGWYFMPEPLRTAQLPFGLPLLLAPLTALFPGQYDLLRFVSLAATVVSVSLLFWGWRSLAPGFSYWWGLALIALFALSPLTILFARVIMSEAPFLMWCLAAILLAERLAARATIREGIWFGLALLGLVYTRTIGLVFVAALVLYLVIRLRVSVWRPLAAAAVAFIVAVGVLVGLTPLNPNDLVPGEYTEMLLEEVSTRAGAGPTRVWPQEAVTRSPLFHLDFTDWLPARIEQEIEPFLVATGLDALRVVPGFLLIGLLFYGGLRWYRTNGVTAFWIVTPIYLLALFFWTWEGSRFFYPIQPQLLLALMLGVYGILNAASRIFPSPARALGIAAGSLLLLTFISMLLVNLRSGTWFLPHETRGADIEWIARETPTDAVLLTSRPMTYYLYVRRQFVPVPDDFWDGPSSLVRQLRAFDVDYVIAPAYDNPLTTDPTNIINSRNRFLTIATELAGRNVLVPRFTFVEGDAAIFEVDRVQLALEPE